MTKEEIQKNSEHWYNKYKDAEKRIGDLENQNRLLGERCNQLLNDKGNLTDQIADIKANCDLAIEGRDIKIKELEKKNSKLESDFRICEKNADTYYDQLTKATELLNEFMRISKASDEDFEHDYSELIGETEQFIREIEK